MTDSELVAIIESNQSVLNKDKTLAADLLNGALEKIAHFSAVRRIDDESGNVAKFVFTNKTAVAEAVLYKYPDYETRTVICCSTQSGCPVGCRFCGAGDYFVRTLTSDEIVEQVSYCIAESKTDAADMKRLQIMFMSMGEPALAQSSLVPTIERLSEAYPNAALLISTSAPQVDWEPIFDVSERVKTVGLQFSVHESTDAARDILVPFKKKMTLSEIANLGCDWALRTGRSPFFNYCAHDKNSTDEDANRLLKLYDPSVWCATVSVICERSDGLPATNEHQRNLATDFAKKLVSRGYNTRVFDPAGQDTIGGGCGQLWFVQKWMKDHPDRARPSIGYGRTEVHVPSVEAAQ